MKSIQQVMTILEDGIIPQLFGAMTFLLLVSEENTYPEEPKDGIALGEEFSYEIEVKDGIMNLKFTSEGHETKTFTKNLIESEYTTTADIPEQTQNLFVPIGQDGVERENAYADEGCFFKLRFLQSNQWKIS